MNRGRRAGPLDQATSFSLRNASSGPLSAYTLLDQLRERGFRVVLGTAEETADFREELEEPGGIADAAALLLEHREVPESVVRPPGQPPEKLTRQRPLEMEVAVSQEAGFALSHGFPDLRP